MSPAMAFAVTVAAATLGVFAAAIGGYVLGSRGRRRVAALPRRHPGTVPAAGSGWFGEQDLPACPETPDDLYVYWQSHDVLSDSDLDED